MTLEEIIAYCQGVADYDCFTDEQRKCSENHYQIVMYLNLLQEILDSGDCNGCGISTVCQIKPKLGRLVRYNCPLFVKREEE